MKRASKPANTYTERHLIPIFQCIILLFLMYEVKVCVFTNWCQLYIHAPVCGACQNHEYISLSGRSSGFEDFHETPNEPLFGQNN